MRFYNNSCNNMSVLLLFRRLWQTRQALVFLFIIFTAVSPFQTVRAQYQVEVGKRTVTLNDSIFLESMRRDTFTLSAERDTLLRRLLRNAYFINPLFENRWTYQKYVRHYKKATSAQFRREFKRYLARTYGYENPVDLMQVVQDITKDDWQTTDEDRAEWTTRILNGYKIYLLRQVPNLPPEEIREHLRLYATTPNMTLKKTRRLFLQSASVFKFYMLNILPHGNICFHKLERCDYIRVEQALASAMVDRIFWYLTYE